MEFSFNCESLRRIAFLLRIHFSFIPSIYLPVLVPSLIYCSITNIHLFRELLGSVTIYLCEENYKSGHENTTCLYLSQRLELDLI